MPVVNLRVDKLLKLLKREISLEELSEYLALLGLSVEERQDNILRVEYNPNRPDFSSVYGVARALQGFLGIRTGLPRYRPSKPRVKMYVDASVKDIRPFIGCAVVRGLRLDEDDLQELIAMQEDLHWIIGRNRKKMAIGLHDFSVLTPPFTYRAVKPDEVRFTPLKDYRRMTPAEVLAKNEIGRKYSWLVASLQRIPVLVDSRGEVFSMPPVVNAALTELTPGVREVFIDVTGTEKERVSQALNILASALADAGGKVEQVSVLYKEGRWLTPDMRPYKMQLDVTMASALTGLELTPTVAARLLRRMRMDVAVKGRSLTVTYPAYRVDILHPADLVEEISIAYGYNKMEPIKPASNTYGRYLYTSEFYEKVCEVMLGLGFSEVYNLLLTNEKAHYEIVLMDEERHVMLANPATREYTMLRTSLIPSLLSNLAMNKDNLYPQRIFELGDVVLPDEGVPEKAVRRKRLAAATAHADAGYTEIKSVLDELFKQLGKTPAYSPISKKTFIEGRCASVIVDGVSVGVAGEVAPQVLENLGLAMPAAVFEIRIEELAPKP
jgi:phenylalanyl-tRNA synthetase beta chain